MGTKVNSNYEDLLTFTRASKGHALRPVSYGSEEVTNGTFDSDVSGWTETSASTSVSASGVEVTTTSTDKGGIVQAVSLTVGNTYVFSVDQSGANDAIVQLGSAGFSGETYQNTAVDGSLYFSFVADFSTTYISLRVQNAASGQSCTFDNVSLKEVTFDQPDGTLTLFEHPDNIPRVEWDSAGNRLGLLVEESRTNLILNSSDFSASSWTKSGSSISAATNITAPDGTTNSFKLIESSSTEVHRVQGAQAAGGTTSTMSCFMKKAERSWGNINFAGLTQGQAWFDLENGVLGTVQTAVTARIEDYGNGWYRCSVTATPTSAATTDIKIANADGAVSYAGDGTSGIYVFGAQTEAGSFPTSYIKTTGSTATRSADVASIPVADFGYNQGVGSLLVEAKRFGTSSEFPRIAQLTDGTSSERIGVSIYGSGNTAYANVYDGGVSQASLNEATSTGADTYAKLGFSFADNDFAFAVDGVVEGTDTSGTVPDNISEMLIGDRVSANQQLNGHIKSIKYYPRRLTNAQLQALTEPRSTPTLSLTFDGLESSYTENYIHG